MSMKFFGLFDKKTYTKEEQDSVIRQIDATMSLEGMPLKDGDDVAMRRILSGESTVDEEVKQVLAKYRKMAVEKGWTP